MEWIAYIALVFLLLTGKISIFAFIMGIVVVKAVTIILTQGDDY